MSGAGQGYAGEAGELTARKLPLVGRDAELAGLHAALDAAARGAGGLLLLAGEPGIGKTRLAEEASEYARGRGAVALWGRCGEASGAPPYWPWVQLLGAYVRGCDDDTLAAQLGAAAPHVAQILPELRERLPERSAGAAGLSPELARLALFDAVASWLVRASGERPLVLVLDDLHAADGSSLLLLRFVANQVQAAPVLLIAAYRDVEAALTPGVSERLAELDAPCMTLRGLGVSDLARMIERGYGVSAPPELLATLHQSTRGNPFFVHVLLSDLLTADGRLEPERGVSSTHWMPGSVHQVIRARLEPLGPDAGDLLSVAAVSGDECDAEVLQRVTQRPRDELVDMLEKPSMTRVMSRIAARPGHYRFAHALVREAVYQSLDTARRARLHRQIAGAIEDLHGAELGPHLSDLAHHAFEGVAGGGDVDAAVTYAARAAEWAVVQLAYEQAAAHYDRAVRMLELSRDADPRRRFDLLLAAGRVLNAAGRSGEARTALRKAAELARELEDPQRLARTALAFGIISTQIQGGIPDAELIDLLVESRSALGQADTGARAMVLARLAYELQLSGEPVRIRAMADDAVATSRRLGDPATLAYALMWAEPGLGWADLDARFTRASEMIGLAERHGSAELAMMGRIRRVRGFVERGDLPAADAVAAELGQVANQARLLSYRWWLALWDAQRAALLGRFADAERLTRGAFDIGQVFNRAGAELHRDLQLLMLYRDQGRFADFETLVQKYLRGQVQVSMRCLACLVSAECGDIERARFELHQLAGDDFSRLRDDQLWIVCAALLAEVCSTLDDTARASRLYARLEPYAGRCVYSGVVTAYHGTVARCLALLATTLRRWSDATAHFDTALRIDGRMAARPWLARTQHEYARMLLQRGAAGDQSAAQCLREQALTTARTLGMGALTDRIASSA